MVTFIATIWAAGWAQNKRIDEISKRIDDLIAHQARTDAKLDAILAVLPDHDKRLKLEVGKWR